MGLWEYSNFLQGQPRPKMVDSHTLQSFTDPGHKQKSIVAERKAWTVQYNGPFPLQDQRISPTQVLNNEQSKPPNFTVRQ